MKGVIVHGEFMVKKLQRMQICVEIKQIDIDMYYIR